MLVGYPFAFCKVTRVFESIVVKIMIFECGKRELKNV
jgi:hypothetical protein